MRLTDEQIEAAKTAPGIWTTYLGPRYSWRPVGLLDTIDALKAERDAGRKDAETNMVAWSKAWTALGAAVARAEEAEARNAAAATDIAFALIGDPADPAAIAALERALAALRGESAPDTQPAPCAHCDDRRIVCSYCAFDAATGSTDWYCGNPDGDPDAVPCPSCSASPAPERKVTDLMEALQQSLDRAKADRSASPGGETP